MTGIVDYNAGNIKSVERALAAIGAEYRISKDPRDLAGTERIIFPGVGEAKFAMNELKKTGFDSFLRDWAHSGKPMLGVCLGSQVIFEHSEEGDTTCLGLIPGVVRRFPADFPARGLKIPHMGWNDVHAKNGGTALLRGIPDGTNFYFVHSYYVDPADPTVVTATADYGFPVPCAVKRGNIEAFQFHPEKSGTNGLRILANFTGVSLPAGMQGGASC
ncbi:MAG TPA: imidazole glycerol phosphate synthase subunit HisH [Treponemataceae bacterium]|nr:imidazole glycerol phosphate synthase subunit HisH [Treponemataceae bacterium]HPS43865.1 imidazole glycerol phosphate synthase subunit HisH [Treponemataceae bacterium]